MNFAPEDISSGYIRDRVKIGSSLADVDPMNIDRSVSSTTYCSLGYADLYNTDKFNIWFDF